MSSPRIVLKTHRHSFSDPVQQFLSDFAKIHELDDRHTFKDAWKQLLEEETTATLIHGEVKRLEADGLQGDILDKMFKSARYYYRKRPDKKTEEKERKVYEGVSKEVIEEMDDHILTQISRTFTKASATGNNNLYISPLTPAQSFDQYCIDNKETLLSILKLKTNDSPPQLITKTDILELAKQLKKTYKNRFYKIRQTLVTN
jgi:hypothetical protein